MSEWEKVEYIQNILVTVDGGQSSSSIYGNERNCAAVTISFNGMNDKLDNPYIDLRKVDIGPYTCLIDYDTGETLRSKDLDMLMSEADEGYGLFYSYSSGKFCNSSPSTGINPADSLPGSELRAKITYYVYGKCTIDMIRMVAAQITLHDGKVVSTDDDSNVHKVDISLKKPILYRNSDLEPISWRQVFENKSDKKSTYSTEEQVAFAKLRRELGLDAVWIDLELENFRKSLRNKELLTVATWDFRPGTTGVKNFTYLCNLGKQSTQKIKLLNTEIELEFNQEPDAFCMVYLKTIYNFTGYAFTQPSYGKVYDPNGLIKLYDLYGNLGEFKMNFDELNDADGVEYPTLVTQNT